MNRIMLFLALCSCVTIAVNTAQELRLKLRQSPRPIVLKLKKGAPETLFSTILSGVGGYTKKALVGWAAAEVFVALQQPPEEINKIFFLARPFFI